SRKNPPSSPSGVPASSAGLKYADAADGSAMRAFHPPAPTGPKSSSGGEAAASAGQIAIAVAKRLMCPLAGRAHGRSGRAKRAKVPMTKRLTPGVSWVKQRALVRQHVRAVGPIGNVHELERVLARIGIGMAGRRQHFDRARIRRQIDLLRGPLHE